MQYFFSGKYGEYIYEESFIMIIGHKKFLLGKFLKSCCGNASILFIPLTHIESLIIYLLIFLEHIIINFFH